MAPSGTLVVIWVSEFTVNTALVPLKLSEIAPVNPVPLMVTDVPEGPLVGVIPLIAGAGQTVKLPVLVAVPPEVVALTSPVVAPVGTVAVICVSEFTVKVGAAVPLKSSEV